MKRKQLTMAQLGMMSNALMKNLFPAPSKTELLVEEKSTAKGDGLYLYFDQSYFDRLVERMQEQHANGSFAKSNAENDWIDLMHAIISAENISDINVNNLRPHFLAK